MATIATHNGSQAHRQHNIRAERVVSKEEHIEKNGRYEIWHDEAPRAAYHKLFNEAVKAYNAKQTRADRQIKDYYSKIEKDDKKHPVYEMIIGIYPGKCEHIEPEVQKAIMRDFVDDWAARNPNLYMCGAYYHADEQGEPHVHIDYIPIAHGYERSMETQTGLVKALSEQGFEKQGRLTAQMQWQARENKRLEELCIGRGLTIEHPTKEKQEHLHTELYKAQKALNERLEQSKELLDVQDVIRAETAKLEHQRDKAEQQAQKALERKARALSRSFKKDKDKQGFTYNKALEIEIRSLVKERAADAKAITKTDKDLTYQYNTAKLKAEQAKQAYTQAKDYRDKMEDYIRETAEGIAESIISQEYQSKDINKRLEDYCAELTFSDGTNALERFKEQERKRERQVKQRIRNDDYER